MDKIRFCDDLLEKASERKASDIHIEPGDGKTRIRFRISGDLYEIMKIPSSEHGGIISRFKILSRMDIAEQRLPQDGRFRFLREGRYTDVRVSTIRTVAGEKMVLRLLDREVFDRLTESVAGDPEDRDKIRSLMHRPDGMILVTGPTGCGKTTTLYGLLREEKKETENITTIEDPVEYRLEGINQMQINEAAGLGFDNALRSVLRQDPDTVLIGEIRDRETAEIAVRAAITGHKVYGTLHTVDTYSAAVRLLDMGIEDYLLSSALTGVISQRLVKALCPKCKKPRPVTEDEKNLFEAYGLDCDVLYEPQSCEDCLGGFKGRVPVMEILPFDGELKEMLKTKPSAETLREKGREKGIPGLFEKALQLAAKGGTSLGEAGKIGIESD